MLLLLGHPVVGAIPGGCRRRGRGLWPGRTSLNGQRRSARADVGGRGRPGLRDGPVAVAAVPR
ncbi:MAG: hypothetical protein WKF73_09290, partial [Nocardioidaceae bacterium]